MLDTVYTHSESSYKEESIGMLTSSLPIQQMADGIKNAAAAIMNLIHLQFPKKQSEYC